MKRTRIIAALLSAVLLCPPVLTGCGGSKKENNETEAKTGGETVSAGTQTDAGTETEEVLEGKTDFTVKTAGGVLSFSVVNDRVTFTDLATTEKGINRMAEGSVCKLPTGYALGGKEQKFDWKYQSCEKYTDETGGAGYILHFRDSNADFRYRMTLSGNPAYKGPFEITGYLDNGTGEEAVITPAGYFTARVKGDGKPTVWRFNKESGQAEGITTSHGCYEGTGIYKKVLEDGAAAVSYASTNQDWNCGGLIPMQYLDYGDNGIYYAMEWTNGTLTATGADGDGTAHLSVCLAEGNFVTRLPDGESLYFPTVYLGVYDGDVDDGSNLFKRWFYQVKMPDCMRSDPNEPLTQQDMQIGYDVAKYGIQAIKWDYGWWSQSFVGSWKSNEGLLEVHDRNYLKQFKSAGVKNLKEYVKKVNEAGVTLTLYVLLRDTQLDKEGVPTSVGENGHPEWFSDRCVTGVGNSADLGNKECTDFFKDYLCNFFKKNKVTTWRSDFEPICRSSDKDNRHYANGSDVQYWCTVGFGELVDYLYDNLSFFRYESCSSGGAMKDLYTATKAAVINCDDSADFLSLHTSFYDSSYCIHPMQLQLPCNASTYIKGATGYRGDVDYLYGLRCVMTGGVMLSNWSGTQTIEKSNWPKQIGTIYNTMLKPLIREGDLYHILPRPDGIHWDGLEYIDPDSENDIKGVVMLWKPTDTEGDEKTVLLRGLDADKKYKLTFQDRTKQSCVMTGGELMTMGLTVEITEACGSEMIWIREA